MDFRHDGYDLWVFRRRSAGVEYLLLRASQDKADRWFGGGQFWQVPSDFVGVETVASALTSELERYSMRPLSLWAAEHSYTIYNRRYDDVVHLSVFAAEVEADDVRIDAGHAEYKWCSADSAAQRVAFRGLKDGLKSVREYVTERPVPLPELRLL